MITCSKCLTQMGDQHAFCEACGEALDSSEPGSNSPKKKQSKKGKPKHPVKEIKSARIAIMVVAVLQLGMTIFIHITTNIQIADFRADPLMEVDEEAVGQLYMIVVGLYIVSAVFVAMWFWAKANPFAACLTALIVFVTLHLIDAAMDPSAIARGILMKIIVIVTLVRGVKAGLKWRSMTDSV